MVKTLSSEHSRNSESADALELNKLLLPKSPTLLSSMKAIDQGGIQIALACREGGVLVGLITDGDVRRALINGASLADSAEPFITRDFVRVSPEQGRNEVIDLMTALRLKQLPIVDAQGMLCGLHLLETLIAPATLTNIAVILAGGKGTRLRPITEHFPKPMLKVAGRPILERLVLHLAGHGIRKIYLATNYMAQIIEDHFQDGKRFGCEIDYLREDAPLGTAGSLNLLPNLPKEPVLVANGDLVTQFDVASMIRTHTFQKNKATIGVKVYNQQIPFGCVSLTDGRVTKLVEKPRMTSLVNAGIYILEPSVIETIQPRKATQMTDLLCDCVEAGERVGVYELTDDWIDVGQKESLALAQGGC